MSSSCHGMPVSQLLPYTNLGSVVQGNHYQKYNIRLIQQIIITFKFKRRSTLTVFNTLLMYVKEILIKNY